MDGFEPGLSFSPLAKNSRYTHYNSKVLYYFIFPKHGCLSHTPPPPPGDDIPSKLTLRGADFPGTSPLFRNLGTSLITGHGMNKFKIF